ncbi:MAG: GNAT family N-acetyltransferase [Eubacteriaceae bacterium]|jgi:GNAT superfamily N-acetyltransferase|nr:GNAT family N-acetyltransferase [Eubacteriaceae bacterium]
MQFEGFGISHIKAAEQIALQNYEQARSHAPELPRIDSSDFFDLGKYAQNGLGVAAISEGELAGYLCSVSPIANALGISGVTGAFSPLGANGAIGSSQAGIYARMYQAAGGIWAQAGASSHAVCLYAHNKDALAQFFRYGFGMRSIDAIRSAGAIAAPENSDYIYSEVSDEQALDVMELENLMHQSFLESPVFLRNTIHTEAQWLEYWNACHPICFAANANGKLIAFILAERTGENFIKDTQGYMHITGMFCLPEHRGKGVSQNLLNLVLQKIGDDGCARLGVDYESINPSGYGFWSKYFTAYSYSVVRRIDEDAARAQTGRTAAE